MSERFYRLFFWLAAAIFASGLLSYGVPASGAARQQPGSHSSRIEGSVSDEQTGAPVAGAEVALLITPPVHAVTDSKGHFVLADISIQETYRAVTITVQAGGYGSWTMRNTLLYPAITRLLTVRLGAGDTLIDAGLPRALTGESQQADDTSGPSLQAAGHDVPPDTIRVAHTGFELCSDWINAGRPILWVEEMDFKQYVKNVLPNEWVASWQPEALRAGAMAVKTFAWVKVLTQVRAPYGADILDNTCDQYYVPSSEQASTSAAVDDTWNYMMHRDGQLFHIFYLNTRARCDTSPNQPCMPQWGTQEDALEGYDWQWMLYHYYAPDEILPIDDGGDPDPDPDPDPDIYSYEHVGQEPPPDASPIWMDKDGPYTLEVRIRNTGNVPWYRDSTTACNVYLGTGEREGGDEPLRLREHISPFYSPGLAGWLAGGGGRRVQMREAQVAPGEIATFNFAVALPGSVAGEIREYWSPVVEGVGCASPQWLPGTGMHFWLKLFPFSYSVIGRSPPYNAWHTRPETFELLLRNEGPATWYRASDTPGNTTGYAVHLATGNPFDESENPYAQPDHSSPLFSAGGAGWWDDTPDGNRIVMVEDAVGPGETATFRFSARVPPQAEVIEAVFTPVVEHLGWMEHQEGTSLIVNNNPNRAELREQEPAEALTLAPGQVRVLRLAFTNEGSTTWKRADTLLGTVEPDTNAEDYASPFAQSAWLHPDRPARLNKAEVRPGESGSFSFVVQAPTTPGDYRLRVRPLVEGAWWMEDQAMDVAWEMSVTEPPPGETTLALRPSYTATQVDQTFVVSITASTQGADVNSVAAYLTFDPTLFEVVDAAGSPTATVELHSTLVATATLHAVDNERGTISILASCAAATCPAESFTVAVLRFRVKAAGQPTEIVFEQHDERVSGLGRINGNGGLSLEPTGVYNGVVLPLAKTWQIYLPVTRR